MVTSQSRLLVNHCGKIHNIREYSRKNVQRYICPNFLSQISSANYELSLYEIPETLNDGKTTARSCRGNMQKCAFPSDTKSFSSKQQVYSTVLISPLSSTSYFRLQFASLPETNTIISLYTRNIQFCC